VVVVSCGGVCRSRVVYTCGGVCLAVSKSISLGVLCGFGRELFLFVRGPVCTFALQFSAPFPPRSMESSVRFFTQLPQNELGFVQILYMSYLSQADKRYYNVVVLPQSCLSSPTVVQNQVQNFMVLLHLLQCSASVILLYMITFAL